MTLVGGTGVAVSCSCSVQKLRERNLASEATYGRNVRGANGAAAAAAVNGAGVDVSASIAVRGDPARNALGTISNAKRVTSASLGTPQPYLAARSLVKYPSIDAAPVEVARVRCEALSEEEGLSHALY